MIYLTQSAIYFLPIWFWTYHFFYGRGSDRWSEPIIIVKNDSICFKLLATNDVVTQVCINSADTRELQRR